jgi:hypothetical protein
LTQIEAKNLKHEDSSDAQSIEMDYRTRMNEDLHPGAHFRDQQVRDHQIQSQTQPEAQPQPANNQPQTEN